MRLKAVEAAEIEAAKVEAAAAAAAAVPEKGGKGGGKEKQVAVGGHNNDKDFARRMDVYSKLKAEEAEDLQARVALSQLQWSIKQAEAEEARKKAEAEASTLKAKRRKARLEAAAAADGATGSEAVASLTSSLDASTLSNGGAPVQAEEAVGPILPEFGGLAGVLVHDCGAKMLRLQNANLESGVALPLMASASAHPKPAVLPEAETAAKSFLGPPHNFEGFIGDEVSLDSLMAESFKMQSSGEEDARLAELLEEQAALAREAEQQALQAQADGSGFQTEPLRLWLMSQLMPVVAEGLITIARDRPVDPVRVLAARLMKEAEKVRGLRDVLIGV